VLERLWRGTFNKRTGVIIGHGVTLEEQKEILDSNEEKNKKNIGVEQQLITTSQKI
jgi:hypothetical protein